MSWERFGFVFFYRFGSVIRTIQANEVGDEEKYKSSPDKSGFFWSRLECLYTK